MFNPISPLPNPHPSIPPLIPIPLITLHSLTRSGRENSPELNSYTICSERKESLLENILFLLLPFSSEEINDRWTTGEERISVTPLRVDSIG